MRFSSRIVWSRFLAALAVAALTVVPQFGARADDLTTLRIATLPIDQTADVFFAEDEGFFKQVGLKADFLLMDNGPAIVSALVGGSADIGNINCGSIAVAHEKNLPVKIVAPAGLHVSGTPVDVLAVAANSPIRSAKDLNGKTIGVNALGALPYVGTKAWIARNGGDPSTVHFVEIPFPAMGQALASGRIDAATMTEPFVSASKATTRILADEYDALAKTFVVSGWTATDAWLSAHPAEAVKFQTAMRRAHEWANANHAKSAEILARHTSIPLAVAQTMTRVVFGVDLKPASLAPVLDAFHQFGDLPQPVAGSAIVWDGPH